MPTHLIDAIRMTEQRHAHQKLEDKIVALLTDLNFQEAKSGRIGIRELIYDLLTAMNIFPSEAKSSLFLRQSLLLFYREMQNLQDWKPKQYPAFFIQQVHNRTVSMGLTDVVYKAKRRLENLEKPHLLLHWHAKSVSSELELVLRGHEHFVNSVSVTPSGRYAVSGSDDNTVKIWDLLTGSEVQFTLTGHKSSVTAVAVTPDSRYVISGSGRRDDKTYTRHVRFMGDWSDKIIKIWDLLTGSEVRTLTGHKGVVKLAVSHEDSVTAVAVTPDSRYVISGSSDTTVKIWDLLTGSEVRTLTGHKDAVNSLAVTPDSRYVISGSDDSTVRIWDIITNKYVGTIEHQSRVTAVAVTPDSRYAIFGVSGYYPHRGYYLKIWDLLSWQNLRSIFIELDRFSTNSKYPGVRAVTITPDSKYIIVTTDSSAIVVFDIQTGATVHKLIGHQLGPDHFVNALAITPDGSHLISAGDDFTVMVWGLKMTEKEDSTIVGHSKRVIDVAVSKDENKAISVSEDGVIKVWDLRTGEQKRNLVLGKESLFDDAAISPDNRNVAFISNALTLFDLEKNQVVQLPCKIGEREYTDKDSGYQGAHNSVAFNSNGQRILAPFHTHQPACFEIWDLNTDYIDGKFEEPDESVMDIPPIAMVPNSDNIIWITKYGDIQLLNRGGYTSYRGIKTFGDHTAKSLVVAPDGTKVISISEDGMLKVWDICTGKKLPHYNNSQLQSGCHGCNLRYHSCNSE